MNAIRLLLALLVVVSHAWPLMGYEWEPNLGGLNLGTWAVVGFFAISGYLITRSRLSPRPTAVFWSARVRRIVPGLVAALLVVAFVFAPIAAASQPGAVWDPLSSVTYVLRNIALYPERLYQYAIDDTLVGFRFRDWDGPLWTLFWEGVCYVAIGVAVTLLGRDARLRRVIVGLFIALTVASLVVLVGPGTPEIVGRVLPLLTAFAAGSILAVYPERVPVSRLWVAAAAVVLAAVILLRFGAVFAMLPVAYLVLLVSTVLPLHRVGSKFDISYGVYIYAWPVQQLAIVLLGRSLPIPVMLALVIAGTVPLAFASCALVERPALKRRGRVPQVVPAP